jgi:WD40 repeat protein
MRRVGRQRVASGGWGRFSSDGRLFVRGDLEGSAAALDARTLRPLLEIPHAHAGFVISVDTDPAGQMLATGSSDGTTRLWDLRTGRPVGAPLPGVPNRWVAARFLADGALAAVYDDGRAWRWDVRPGAWKAHACRVAGRTLTRDEWRELLPGRKYTPACAVDPSHP